MNKNLFKSEQRGAFKNGWLDTHYSFSFANWIDYSRIGFGVLRVLNDDIIQKGAGFGTHPHENMEIITIPLEGTLAHKDSTGTNGTVTPGEVQVMSAGTGIFHSEYNASETEDLKLMQIWILTKSTGIEPRYDQKSYEDLDLKNQFQIVVSGDKNMDQTIWINQDAFISLAKIDTNQIIDYKIQNQENGLFIFAIEGEIEVENMVVEKRDSLELSDIESDKITVKSNTDSFVMIIEVPMG